jgi:ribonuclease HII
MSHDNDMISCEIVEDSDLFEPNNNKLKKHKKEKPLLKTCFENDLLVEIGVDEAGRGPLFGRVYSAAVILPKDDQFDHSKMKDSKTFHSEKKIQEVAEYIKEHALSWCVTFEDEKTIDEINILQATQKSMHHSILKTMEKYYKQTNKKEDFRLLIDVNYFKPFTKEEQFNLVNYSNKYTPLCIEKGDNNYTSIAAASILAKVERDQYILDLCDSYPELGEKYGIPSNKGYGAKKHLEGIKEHGITIWHRRSFGICKQFS